MVFCFLYESKRGDLSSKIFCEDINLFIIVFKYFYEVNIVLLGIYFLLYVFWIIYLDYKIIWFRNVVYLYKWKYI